MPRFGTYIRAKRLGYHWSKKHQAFIRFSDYQSDYQHLYLVEVAPGDCVIECRGSKKELHYVWWENEDITELLDSCEPLRKIHDPVEQLWFIVTEFGKRVTGSVTTR